jgi:histidinol phosphatase-like PHP family hydrolase
MNHPIDYHVHLSPDLTIERAAALSKERSVPFGIVEHPGPEFGIASSDELSSFADRIRSHGMRAGLQPVVRGWSRAFSREALSSLDYVLMDADTVPWDDGSFLRIWQHDIFLSDIEDFMERYWQHIVGILSHEPIHIFARPTYLPAAIARHYDEIWTDEHMRRIIDLAVDRGIALEIAEQVRVPSLQFVKMAKHAGATFTFGTNARDDHAGDFHYCTEIAERAGLTDRDFLAL